MIHDDITRLVTEHYQDAQSDVLLLSHLGEILAERELWPVPGERRSLLDILEGCPNLAIVRDEDVRAFIVVVPRGDEYRALSAIADRHKRQFLEGLPRAFLLAFTLDLPSEQEIAVRLGEKVTYQVGLARDSDAVVVERDLRLPGLDIAELGDVSDKDIERLELNIRTWCERNGVEANSLVRRRRPRVRGQRAIPVAPSAPAGASALERLLSAQSADVAKRMAIPADIALLLSRHP